MTTDLVQGATALIAAIAGLIASIAAFFGVSQWRRQMWAKAAERPLFSLSSAAVELEDALRRADIIASQSAIPVSDALQGVVAKLRASEAQKAREEVRRASVELDQARARTRSVLGRDPKVVELFNPPFVRTLYALAPIANPEISAQTEAPLSDEAEGSAGSVTDLAHDASSRIFEWVHDHLPYSPPSRRWAPWNYNWLK